MTVQLYADSGPPIYTYTLEAYQDRTTRLASCGTAETVDITRTTAYIRSISHLYAKLQCVAEVG